MSKPSLDELLERMPDIAKAVNAFNSEAVQQQVFGLLTRSLDSQEDAAEGHSARQGGDSQSDTEKTGKHNSNGTKTDQAASKGRNQRASKGRNVKPATTPRIVPDLNLRPSGTQSFRDFIQEKQPKTNEERYAVVIYYLRKMLALESINKDHIYTAFKDANIRVPKDIDGGLRKAGSRKGWVNTEDKNDLKITVNGENLVEHDLPRSE